MKKIFIVGGAGFIGSHFCDYLLSQPTTEHVTIYDNFSSGKAWHLAKHEKDKRLRLIRGNISDFSLLQNSIAGHDLVIHLASNPDISKIDCQPSLHPYKTETGSFHFGLAVQLSLASTSLSLNPYCKSPRLNLHLSSHYCSTVNNCLWKDVVPATLSSVLTCPGNGLQF